MLAARIDEKMNLLVCYGTKPLEFSKGTNATELASEAEVADTLGKVQEAAKLGELDALIEQQVQSGRRLTLQNLKSFVKDFEFMAGLLKGVLTEESKKK